jgi:prealbumin domain-containing protein
MKTNISKCIWIACIAVIAMCITVTNATAQGGNGGNAYISSVVGVNGECAVNTQDGKSHHWDVQAGGTYIVTLTGATDVDFGYDGAMDVVVHNSCGTNINAVANQTPLGSTGVYTFTVTIPSGTACGCTTPIEYYTRNAQNEAAFQPGSGYFAQGYDGTGGDGLKGDLRVSTFDPGTCNVSNPACSTTTPCTGSITAAKFYDFNADSLLTTGEQLLGWQFCLTPINDDGSYGAPIVQSSVDGGKTTFSNLPCGTYILTEGTASGYFATTTVNPITISQSNKNPEVDFGNYCTIASGGLTMGFWSNKNGQAVLQANYPVWVTLLNNLNLKNATGADLTINGSSFSTAYSQFRTWLLAATATNMAYMLSAQLSALELDVAYKGVLGTSFDLCSDLTINDLMLNANASLGMYSITTSSSDPVDRAAQEHLKNCIDAINNNGQVIPAAPCAHTNVSVTCPTAQ